MIYDLLAINKAEKKAIAERFPDAHIVRTMKCDSSRGHYYIEETQKIVGYLKELRAQNVIEEHGTSKHK